MALLHPLCQLLSWTQYFPKRLWSAGKVITEMPAVLPHGCMEHFTASLGFLEVGWRYRASFCVPTWLEFSMLIALCVKWTLIKRIVFLFIYLSNCLSFELWMFFCVVEWCGKGENSPTTQPIPLAKKMLLKCEAWFLHGMLLQAPVPLSSFLL